MDVLPEEELFPQLVFFPELELQRYGRNYEIDNCLFLGSQVYHGINLTTREEVAIKYIKSYAFNNTELEILQRVNGHPNIVSFIEHFDIGEYKCLVFEYCNGRNLKFYLFNNGKFQESTAWLFLRQIVPVLDYLRNQGIMHRNLDLENILLCISSGNEVQPRPKNITFKIAGFGKAFMVGRPVTPLHISEFMAPEEVQNQKQPHPKADLFRLGKLLEICVVKYNELDYEENDFQNYGISKKFKTLLFGLLVRDPVSRTNLDDLLRQVGLQPLMQQGIAPQQGMAPQQGVALQQGMVPQQGHLQGPVCHWQG